MQAKNETEECRESSCHVDRGVKCPFCVGIFSHFCEVCCGRGVVHEAVDMLMKRTKPFPDGPKIVIMTNPMS